MPNNKAKFVKNSYFPTLVFQITLPNPEKLNDHLLKAIYKDRDEDQDGIYRSNVKELGGWHSHINLHESKTYSKLVREINAASKRMADDLTLAKDHAIRIGSMWSIINPRGSMNIAHIHPGCTWSGVYYVQAPKGSGKIEFIEPRTVHMMNQPKFENKSKRPRECWTKVNFEPKPGKMIIFPAWLYHSVRPNASTETGDNANRVIISFNLSQKKISK